MYACIVYLVLFWITLGGAAAEKSAGARDEDTKINQDLLDAIPFSSYQIVYPIQRRLNEILPDLETRDYKAKTKNAHYHHTNFEIQTHMFDERSLSDHSYRIRLEQNREILSIDLKQKHNRDEKVQIVEGLSPENCYYQGEIRRNSDSKVIVSTCGGIRGLIFISNKVFLIQPLRVQTEGNETRFPHAVSMVSSGAKTSCGNRHGMWKSYKSLHQREFLGNIKIMKPQEENAFENTKYLHLALVADHTLFDRLNGTVPDSLRYLVLLANIVDALLKDFKMRVRLVYAEIWNQQDLFNIDASARMTLTTFLKYRLDTMTHTQFDFAHFITGQALSDGELGMAVPDSICSDRSIAVSQAVDVQDLLQVATGVTHMLGHVLGIEHDTTEDCACTDIDNGCLMNEQTSLSRVPNRAHVWSTCSKGNVRISVLSRLTYCLVEKSATKATFESECGNGVTERGEECDCVNKEECDFTDPCCDPKTCLMRPWAMCRHGDCCHNCTVRPSNQMCREELGQCDVPEFCDGILGDCPVNALVQDGQACENSDSFCYRGECQPYMTQCKNIWGRDAVAGDDKCYEIFNVGGRFNGHCGRNASSSEYLRCTQDNIRCGLLHCANGSNVPLNNQNKTFSITTIASNGNNYQCKIINGNADSVKFGMVKDGSKCSADGICIGTECVPLSRVMPARCPTGPNGIVCSGHGKCTTDVRCFCSYNFTGADCSQKTNRTFIPLRRTTLENPPPVTDPVTEIPLVENITEALVAETTMPLWISPAINPITRSDETTLQLIIALSVVVGGAIIVLAFCLFCYRRQSPVNTRKKKSSVKKTFGSVASFSSSSHSKSGDQIYDSTSRSITFGPLPSYRAHKIKKAMRGGISETDSEHSRGDRDSTEIKAATANTLPLARPPEKGILKKHPRSADNVRRSRLGDYELSRKRESGVRSPLATAEDGGGKVIVETNSQERVVQPLKGKEERRAADGGIPDNCSSDDGLDFIDDERDDDDDDDSCNCSDDEDDDDVDESPTFPADVDAEEAATNRRQFPRDDVKRSTPTSPPPRQDGGKVGEEERKKLIKKNINDLLEKLNEFDKEFNSVCQTTQKTTTPTTPTNLSPTNSEEIRSSETEVDRSYPRGGFFRQDDGEKGFGGPNFYSSAPSRTLDSKGRLDPTHHGHVLPPTSESTRLGSPEKNEKSKTKITSAKPGDRASGLPDLVNAGLQTTPPLNSFANRSIFGASKAYAETGGPARNNADKFQSSTSSSSGSSTSHPLGSPLCHSTPPNHRSPPPLPPADHRTIGPVAPKTLVSLPMSYFVPKKPDSFTSNNSSLAENFRVASPPKVGATGGGPAPASDPVSSIVPYRGVNTTTTNVAPFSANITGSPRQNRRQSEETGFNRLTSDRGDSSVSIINKPTSVFTSAVAGNHRSATNSDRSDQSDRGNNSDDTAIIVRELPTEKEFSFVSNPRSSSVKSPILLSSPEDIDV